MAITLKQLIEHHERNVKSLTAETSKEPGSNLMALVLEFKRQKLTFHSEALILLQSLDGQAVSQDQQALHVMAMKFVQAVLRMYPDLPLAIHLAWQGDTLHYIVCRTDSSRCNLPMDAATTTIDDLCKAIDDVMGHAVRPPRK